MSQATLRMPSRAVLSVIAGAAIAASGAACTPPRAPIQPHPLPLAAIVDPVAGTPPLDRTHRGIEVYDPERRRRLYRRTGGLPLRPASNGQAAVTAEPVVQ